MVKIALCFFVCCLITGCYNPRDTKTSGNKDTATALHKESIFYRLFRSGNGYGFNIFKDGKLYIHQPIVPMREGFVPFSTKHIAESIATLTVRKLSGEKFRFLFKKGEVNSIMKDAVDLQSCSELSTLQTKGMGILPALPLTKMGKKVVLCGQNLLPKLKDGPIKQTWEKRGIVPFGNRSGAFSFSIGNNIYVGGGQNTDEFTNELWEFNTTSGAWTCLSDIPIKDNRRDGIAFALLNKGYWGLGGHSDLGLKRFNNDFYQYDPFRNKWVPEKKFAGTPRVDACAFTEGGKGYVGGGYDESFAKDFYQYDPIKDRWKRVADFGGGPVSSAASISLGKKGFIVAGDRFSGNQKFLYEYVAEKDKWLKRKDLPGPPRYYLGGCNIDSNFFIAGTGGAKDSTNRLRDFYIYDAAKDSWTRTNDYPVSKLGISNVTSVNANGKLFLGTGFNGNYLNDWNEFGYYFSVRIDEGNYNETTSYPLKCNGQWQLYQECNNDDCFAGVELKSDQPLGNFHYTSSYKNSVRNITIKDEPGKKLFLFPRSFFIKTDEQPKKPVSLRLFFTKSELEAALSYCNKKTGLINSLYDLQIIQCNENTNDQNPLNVTFPKNTRSIIKPYWYSYGYNGETMVAEFSVTSLQSEFYLALSSK